jgi:hypothetical protein
MGSRRRRSPTRYAAAFLPGPFSSSPRLSPPLESPYLRRWSANPRGLPIYYWVKDCLLPNIARGGHVRGGSPVPCLWPRAPQGCYTHARVRARTLGL